MNPKETPMFSALLQSTIERHGFDTVDAAGLDVYAQAREHVVLFFPGDAVRLAESDDVAVVLPELIKVFGDRITPAVVPRDSERELQRRYRFNAFPALVFLRNGQYLGVLQRILDWGDYLEQIPEILSREVSDPPPFAFPEHCVASAPGLQQ
ncbi:hydrogenase-1 expression HyaE [Hoeflea sp. TYP-13]|uniref:hydrogenase-1 expression HyaE n=1 Tax=Hoeflea sp. TYP-13 TaxID=3230023 RepID=UPI0034C5DDB6